MIFLVGCPDGSQVHDKTIVRYVVEAISPTETTADRAEQTLEWLFEVKTTIGPCETDFFMSPDQYERVSGVPAADQAFWDPH